ncbi:hypothetical protein [Plantactinospora sp. WMMB782]|uniref:hypothetical protein n=1 Tax=Plantactinospora sp. WMMB782 TaxID=3404121 RepID=UPI003B9474EC
MTCLLFRAPAEGHRALRAPDLTGLHPAGGTRAVAGTNPLAPGTPVPPPTWTSAQQIAADLPERH